MSQREYPTTPDGRYFVVRGRLWRATNPSLEPAIRERLVRDLMSARRAVGAAKKDGNKLAESEAREAVDRAKISLGERGAVWWNDGASDLNRHLASTGPYAEWYASLPKDES